MALRVRKIAELEEVNTFLRGGIIGGKDVRRGVPGYINGRTLIFTTPAITITFATTPANDQIPLSALDVLDQINTGALAAGFARYDNQGRLVVEDPAGLAVVVLANTGTANGLFGFSDATPSTGVVYDTPGSAAPALVSVTPTSLSGNTYLVITDEA